MDELTAEGSGLTVIVAALVEVIVQTAYEDRPWAADLLEGVSVLLTNATLAARLRRSLDDIKRNSPHGTASRANQYGKRNKSRNYSYKIIGTA